MTKVELSDHRVAINCTLLLYVLDAEHNYCQWIALEAPSCTQTGVLFIKEHFQYNTIYIF